LCREKGIDEDSFKCHLKDLGMSGAITFQETMMGLTRKWQRSEAEN
jgi:hypothetical protein